MDLPIITLLTTVIVTSLVATYVFARNYKSDIPRAFLFLILSFVLWALSQCVLYITNDSNLVLIADKLTYVFGLFIVWTFLGFIRVFPYKIKDAYIALTITNALVSLITFALIISSRFIHFESGLSYTSKSFILDLPILFLYTLIFFSVLTNSYLIFKKKYRSATGQSKLQLMYVMLAAAVPFIAGSILNILLINFGIFEYQVYGPSFTMFFTLIVSYMIFFRNRIT